MACVGLAVLAVVIVTVHTVEPSGLETALLEPAPGSAGARIIATQLLVAATPCCRGPCGPHASRGLPRDTPSYACWSPRKQGSASRSSWLLAIRTSRLG